MVRLGQADLEGVLRFLRDAGSVDGDEAFPREVIAGLRRLVPSEWVGYEERDRVRQECLGSSADMDFGIDSKDPGVCVREHEHPVLHFQDATGDFRALKLSDFVTRRELRRSGIYSDWLRSWGVEFQMLVGLDAPLWHTKVFIFDRVGPRDFTERDRAVLNLLRPHLARLYQAAEARRRTRDALSLLGRTDAAVVLLDRAGRIEFATPEARRLLARYFGEILGRLPDDVAAWRRQAGPGAPLTIERPDASLFLHLVGGALLLEEQRASGVTTREREILDLVAEGKTNAEIAAALWISRGTVRRHLDNAFQKLGVHTRAAAVARVHERRASG